MNDTEEGWKFEPDPSTKSYTDYLDKSPITFDRVKHLLDENKETKASMRKAKKPMENLKFRCKLQQADYIRVNGVYRGILEPDGKITYWNGQCIESWDPYLCDVYKLRETITTDDLMFKAGRKVYKLVLKETPTKHILVRLYKEI